MNGGCHVMKIVTVAAVVVGAMVGPASATLVDDQVDVVLRDALANVVDSGTSDPIVAGAGPELTLIDTGPFFGDAHYMIDFEASQIVISVDFTDTLSEFGFGDPDAGFDFSSLDWINDPSGILVGATVSEVGGFGTIPTITSLSDHALTLNVAGYNFTEASVITIDLVTDHDGSAVPEPISATLGVMGLGLLSLAIRRRVA